MTETLHLARDATSGETRAWFRTIPPCGRQGHAPRIHPACAGPRDMRGSNIAIQDRPDRADRADRRSSRRWSEADGSACDTLSYGRRNGGFHRARSLESGDANVAALAFRNSEVVEANIRGSRANCFSLEDWGMCLTFAGSRSSRCCSTHSFLCR